MSTKHQNMSNGEYAHPEALVDTDWIAQHLNDPMVRIIESNEDISLYGTGHIPGAVHVDWHKDLNDQTIRDYLDPEQFAALASQIGITPETTLVFYGDKSNWWACYALWVFALFGHKDLRILNGGRNKWISEARPVENGGQRRWHIQIPRGTQKDLSGRSWVQTGRRHDRLLPNRRTCESHLVCTDQIARVRKSSELRRILDRVGEYGACAGGEGIAPAASANQRFLRFDRRSYAH
jgi:Rhodanese-like domain